MKKITLLLAMFAMINLSAQTVLTEDFEAGLTIPAGWTNNDIDGGGNVWTFATGGEAIGYASPNTIYYVNGGMDGNYAIFDSDGYGGPAEEAALESPVFDCSALTSVTLKYNHFFTSGYGGSASVEVYNGSAWVAVASYDATTAYGLENIDVTAHLAGVTNAQVRFKWIGNYSWGWAFDNVEVYSCTETAAPACTTPVSPLDTATDVVTTDSNDGLSRVVAFSWNAVPGAISYDFVFEGNTLANIPGTSISITGLDYGTAYTWSVIPINCFGAATGCATWSLTTESAPAPPANETCATATPIACGDSISGTSVSSTGTQEGSGCTLGVNGVWYTFAGYGGDINIDVTASFDHALAITSGTCGALVNVDCIDSSTGAESYTITNSVDGETYYVYIAHWSGSSTVTGTHTISITCPTISVGEFAESDTFTYYPNPVNNTLTLKGQKAIQNVAIYNMLGQEVLRTAPNAVKSDVDMSNLQPGAYFVKVTVDNTTKTIKIIKK
ncbi:T9SS type A sorting domain-containing protein [Xanthomarina sp. F2636L]|uniref:T9SS type A sorting domain-containing protein n=1 Tax=Xanthomarina sp. F2636L TaxID=2996018 RepID=UPI00225DE0C3|nr:T9SS type A sorting domain-containing protein [Xanthomarina sp. F2636L]MCX7552187.1 T9SS type A sorting domain-containing protein [Xanthomarina sp. F2636L]